MEEINPWKTLKSDVVYDNPWIRITEHAVINPSGGNGIYGKVHFKNLAIGIIAIDENDEIFLVGQYRYPLNQYSWEIPEGGCPLGTEPLDSAKRELLEETGIVANEWSELLRMHLSNSVSDELAIIYIAKDFTYLEAQPEETEQINIKRVLFDEAYQMVLNGEITDSMSVAAILRMKLIRQSL